MRHCCLGAEQHLRSALCAAMVMSCSVAIATKSGDRNGPHTMCHVKFRLAAKLETG